MTGSPAALPYLLDTNILLALIRGKDLGTFIDTTYQLSAQSQRPLVCVVSVGEIWTLAARNCWGALKRAALATMLQNVVLVEIFNTPQLIQAYVDIEIASNGVAGGAVVMGKNDVWIAAVAKIAPAHLLTTDHDFDHLFGSMIQGTYIDPSSKLPAAGGGPVAAVPSQPAAQPAAPPPPIQAPAAVPPPPPGPPGS